jgi:hypothetical protein
MGTFFAVVTIVAVVGILVAVVGALVELSPLGRHADSYRDRWGNRTGASPHL